VSKSTLSLTPQRRLVNDSQENVFVPLPHGLWKSTGNCDCSHCKGKEGFWDTLAIAPDGSSYTVHYPALQQLPYPQQKRAKRTA
jgi:hypothetical protein